MKKTLILAFVAICLSSVDAVASNNSNLLTVSNVNPVEQSSGTIIELTENGGKIQEDGTGIVREFIRPVVSDVIIGERFEFFKIIQNTPNGSKVINILKGKLP